MLKRAMIKAFSTCSLWRVNPLRDEAYLVIAPFIRITAQEFVNGGSMASVKKGTITPPPQWWKHLRDWKRVFWKRERKAQKRDFATQSADTSRDAKG